MATRKSPLRDRLLSNSPDPMKSSILRESGMGWNPQNTGSISSTSSAESLVSPLRIEKRDSPLRPQGPAIPRRTSSSYKHMSTNNLVSKSPFKSQIPTPATPSTKSMPIAISFPITPTRRVSGEKRQRPSSMHDQAETENARPFVLKRERKQSKAFETLLEKEPVTKSPFRVPKSTNDSKPSSLPLPKRRPMSVVKPESLISNPSQTHSSPRPSPGRSVLVSRRMHGPRLSGSGRRERRKTVTFDERCDVVEFDRDEESDDDVFESGSDEEQDGSEGSMQYGEDEDIKIPMLTTEDNDTDNIDQDDDSYDSIPLAEDDKKTDSLMALDVDTSITGIVDDLFFGPNAHALVDNSLASVTSTPPRQSGLPPDLETEDGVPLGRSHHVERFLQHHSPHLHQAPRISPGHSPQGQSPGRYPFNFNLPTHASPHGPPATPPRRSPGMTHSTPPLGRTTHSERVKEVRELENDDVSKKVANLPPSPSPMKGPIGREHTTEESLIPRFDLGNETNTSFVSEETDGDMTDPFTRSRLLDEAPPLDLEGNNSNQESRSPNVSIGSSKVNLSNLSRVSDLSKNEDSAYLDAESGERNESQSDASTEKDIAPALSNSPRPLTSSPAASPASRAGSPLVRGGSPLTKLSSPLNSTGGLQVNRPRINKDDVKRRLLDRWSLASPSPEPRSPERSMEHRSSPAQAPEDNIQLAPIFSLLNPEQDRDKDRDRMSVMTGMTDMSTDTAIVGHAERVNVAVGSLVSHYEADEDSEFGLLATEDRLKFDFGSKFSLGGLGMSNREDLDMDTVEDVRNSTPPLVAGRSGYRESVGMRMGDHDVDMDMKSALDRLMEDVAGGRVDDSLMTDDSFISQDSQMTEMSLPEQSATSRPKVIERAATDTALLHSAHADAISSRTVSDSSTTTLPPPLPPKDNIKAREQLILRKRRQAKGLDYEEDDDNGDEQDSSRPLAKFQQRHLGVGRPSRRRSMSAGDVQDLTAHQKTRALLELSEVQSDTLLGNIEQELNKLHQEPKKETRYQVRERQNTIYASSSDERISHIPGAGDLSTGRAWRPVRRPSDMNEYAKQIREYRAQDKGKAYGKVFVKVLEIKGIHLPMPREATAVSCTLNNGIHFVTTPECQLGENCNIEQEFELIEHSKLEFTLTIKVRRDPHIITQFKALSAPPSRVPALPPTPIPPPIVQAPSKSSSRFNLFSSSPKKHRERQISYVPPPVPPPSQPPQPHRLPENLARYLKSDGTLARAFIAFKDVIHRCDTRLFETSYPLIGQRAELGGKFSTQQVGEIVIQMFRLPPLPGVPQDELPQSLDDCHRGLRHINWHKVTYFQGTLTQNGGDCRTWRRRQFRVIGGNLVAFNDVTKKATATIDLKKAIRLEDDQNQKDESMYGVERSFRLLFPDNEEIVFFADTDDEKNKWLEILRALVGHIPPHPLWAELLWQRQEEITARAQAARQVATTYDPSSSTQSQPQ